METYNFDLDKRHGVTLEFMQSYVRMI